MAGFVLNRRVGAFKLLLLETWDGAFVVWCFYWLIIGDIEMTKWPVKPKDTDLIDLGVYDVQKIDD